ATPTDVEIALEATFATLPETVLLLDAGDGGLQNDRAVTEQAMERLAKDGRGIVVVSKGLNMALRAAEQVDVPAGVIFRDLDAEDQDARVIRRFLDQAAFRARQESGVLLLARVRPNTISALVLWGTVNRAGQVAVAPVSAVLSGQD
ncbi:MAG: divergent polysaccharide deacetylase family protein, partial [Rhodobacterales bacterium]